MHLTYLNAGHAATNCYQKQRLHSRQTMPKKNVQVSHIAVACMGQSRSQSRQSDSTKAVTCVHPVGSLKSKCVDLVPR